MTPSTLFMTAMLACVTLVAVMEESDASGQTAKRVAVPNKRWLWPAVTDSKGRVRRVLIPYTVKTGWLWFGLGSGDEKLVKIAADEFARHTCLRFVPRKRQKDYIEFVKSKRDVCESSIGRMGGKQEITLGSGCRDRGRIMHEIMHALGFYHEHNRPDRDRYIRVLWSNMKKDSRKQFEKFKPWQVSTFSDPYDFTSIMHYTNYEFSDNGKPTLQAIQDPSMKVGGTEFLSSLDVMKINKLYNCPQAKTLVDDFVVTVITGNKIWAGTDARVYIELYGKHGRRQVNSGELELYGKKGAFERKRVDKFLVVAPFLGPLTKLTVRHDNSGSHSDWFLKKIDVLDVKRRRRYSFRCLCWLRGGHNTKTLTPS